MGLPFELTAENIVHYANENGITLERGAVRFDYPKLCVRATLVHAAMKNANMTGDMLAMYDRDTVELIGLDIFDLQQLEAGFEDSAWPAENNHPFYKMGREVFEMTNK